MQEFKYNAFKYLYYSTHGHGPATPGCLLEMQNLRPHSWPIERQSVF